jgi:hypothetical protein
VAPLVLAGALAIAQVTLAVDAGLTAERAAQRGVTATSRGLVAVAEARRGLPSGALVEQRGPRILVHVPIRTVVPFLGSLGSASASEQVVP